MGELPVFKKVSFPFPLMKNLDDSINMAQNPNYQS